MTPPGSLERSLAGWDVHLGTHHRPDAVRRWLARGSLDGAAARTARQRPVAEALRIDGRPVTHGQLGQWADETTSVLRARGARPGDRMLVSQPSSLEMVASYLGILRAGCVALLANPALTQSELDHLVSDGQPALGLVAPDVLATLGSSATGPEAVRLGGSPSGGEPAVCVEFERGSASSDAVEGPDRAAVLAYTSGTTGRPKGALLSHANLLATCRATTAAWRFGPAEVTVHCLPLFHLHGLSSVNAVLLGFGRAVIESRLDPERLADLLAEERATVLLGVPAVHRRLVEAGPNRTSFATLRLLVSGSAPLPPSLAGEVEQLTGHVPLERYGTTESGLDVSNPYDGERRRGSVGLALPGIELRVAGDDGGELPAGADGEVQVRGPQVFGGYWRRPGGGEVFAEGGWFRTGDIGRIDPDCDYLAITGRAKELIITGGLNVYPGEVEAAIEQHEAVHSVAVAGLPSDRWGEEVTAFVVLRPGRQASEAELAAVCAERLAPYKRPKRIVLVEALPQNALGKVQRERLSGLVSVSEDEPG